MGKVTAKMSVANVETLEELKRYVSIALSDIALQINGGITFSDNISNKIIPFQFTAANSTFTIPHGLGRVPLFWTSGSITANSVIYQTQDPDGVSLYLAASAVCNAKILVI